MKNVRIEINTDEVLGELSVKELVDYLEDVYSIDEYFGHFDSEDLKDYAKGLD